MYISTSADQNIKILSIQHEGCNQIVTYIDALGNIKVKRGLVLSDGTTVGSVLNTINAASTSIVTTSGGVTTVAGKSGTVTLAAADITDLTSLYVPKTGGAFTGALTATTISATTVSAGSFGITATAGTYAKCTINAKGQVTAGAALSNSDIAGLNNFTTIAVMSGAGTGGQYVANQDPIFKGSPMEFCWNSAKAKWEFITGQTLNFISAAQILTPTSAIQQVPVSATIPANFIGDNELWMASFIFEKTVSSTTSDTNVGITIGALTLQNATLASTIGGLSYSTYFLRSGTNILTFSTDPFTSGAATLTSNAISLASAQVIAFKYSPGSVGGTYKLHSFRLTRVS